jgi:purine-binding chemotaxis protein CheW
MRSFLIFRLGPEEFGIEIGNVVEIFSSQKIYEVPEMESYISGVINIRGEVVPLLDLRRRFGLKPAPKKERTVLVRTRAETLGLTVDEVKEILDFDDPEITKPPTIFKGLAAEFMVGLGKKEGRVIILLNLENILTREEIIKLDVQKQAVKDEIA